MNKKILETKIAELLGVSENEKNLAFSIFKEKLSGFLKVGEALRISDLGVFQLKEKLDHSADSKSGNLTLVYSPSSDDQSTESLFVNLELENPIGDDTAFNENVFQLGIGKPLITNLVDNNDKGDQVKSITDKIEDNVSSILEKSEKLEGYDLWEDYLERKETKSILDEPEDTDVTIDSIIEESDREIQDVDLNVLDEDFIPKEEEDLLDEYMHDTNFLSEEIPETTADDLKIDDIEIPDSIDDSLEIETTTEKVNDLNSEIEIPDFKIDKSNIKEEEPNDLSIIEKIDEELEELEIVDKLTIEDPIYEDELSEPLEDETLSALNDKIDESHEEIVSDTIVESIEVKVIDESNFDDEIDDAALVSSFDDNVDEPQEEIISDSIIENADMDGSEEDNVDDKKSVFADDKLTLETQPKDGSKRKPLMLLLLAAFILIAAVGIYYIFFNNSTLVEKKPITEVALVEDKNDDKSETTIIMDEDSKISNDAEVVNKIKDEEKATIDSEPLVSEEMPEITTTEETEVSDNIYYDGYVYNVQVSSWRKESIAKNEVNKLVKKGFPAYKVEVYIPKFKGTWYRVRIGPFPSLVEAQETKQKVNK